MLFLYEATFLPLAAALDLLFNLMLIVAISMSTIKAKQWKQLAVVAKVLLIFIGNIVFFLGYFAMLASGMLYAFNVVVLLFFSFILKSHIYSSSVFKCITCMGFVCLKLFSFMQLVHSWHMAHTIAMEFVFIRLDD